MMRHWFNEYDPHAAQWLRGLMGRGLLPQGEVDERSITELQAEDVAGETCHFFAGIGGWDHALRLAGWPIDRPVWTGSCPCQPFSSAGAQRGTNDERDLWPHFYRLIRECRPDVVFGEQVENAVKFGWLDRVYADLATEGYTVGAVVLGAHSVGAPHQRQRLYWVANSQNNRASDNARKGKSNSLRDGKSGVGHSDVHERHATNRRTDSQDRDGRDDTQGDDGGGTEELARAMSPRRVGDASGARSQERIGDTGVQRGTRCAPTRETTQLSGNTSGGFWDRFEFVNCADGKARRIEPGIFTVVDGVPFRLADGRTVEGVSRAATLKGIGNAIVPQVAAEFVRAFLEAEKELQRLVFSRALRSVRLCISSRDGERTGR